MKKTLLMLAGLVVLSTQGFSQSNVVVFSEDGDPFYAYVNGIRQNDKPETNVKVTGLTSNMANLRVEFADNALPKLKQNMPLEPGMEYAIRIKRDMKKQLKLRYFGETPISKDATPGVTTIPYHSAENTSITNYNTATDANSTPAVTNSNGGGDVSVTSTTVTTTKGTADNTNVGMNVNMSGMGINMSVSGMDPNVQTTTSTTVTTTSSSSSGSYQQENAGVTSYNNNNTTVTTTKASCSAAMNSADFTKLKKSVESKPFSDTKMSTAKVATKNGCLSTAQVKEICKLFNMDDDKLAYAKYAFDYCVDKGNFYQVSEVFSFSSSTEELNKFLEEHQ